MRIFTLFSTLKIECRFDREVAEWSKAHAWKVCILHKGIEGSNPFLSAKALNERFFYLSQRGKLAFQRWRNKKSEPRPWRFWSKFLAYRDHRR